LPLFTGTSPETFRKVPDRVQIDTTLVRQNRTQNHAFIGRHRLLNRTAVKPDLILLPLFELISGEVAPRRSPALPKGGVVAVQKERAKKL
jgi:hypothetical protein